MALQPLRLPRLQQGISLVTSAFKPSAAFVRYWNVELLSAIERFVNDLATIQAQLVAVQDEQASQLVMIQQVQAQQAEQLVLINEALTLAGIAINLAGGNSGSDVLVADISYTGWTNGPQVDLTGVVAGDLTITGTSLQPVAATRLAAFGEQTGQLRIVEIDGMTETVVGGPWTFSATRDVDPSSVPIIMNPSEIPPFTAARTSTGAISYRLDAQMDGTSEMTDVRFYLYAARTT